MFRNLTFIRFPISLDFSELDSLTAQNAQRPIGPLEMSTRGWAKFNQTAEGDALPYVMDYEKPVIFLTLAGEDKILPSSAVNAEVAKRIAAIEEREGRRPGGRERKRIKDDLLHEMLPKALAKPYRLNGFIDTARGLLVVDTASRKAAEDFASHLRGTLGSFPGMHLNAELAPRTILTSWLSGESLPPAMDLSEEAELRDPMDGGAVVRLQRQELVCTEVSKHLDAGKQVTRLGLVLGDHISFTLGDDLVVRKFKLLDGALDTLQDADGEGRAAEIDAMAALLVGEVSQLFDRLERYFRISKAEG